MKKIISFLLILVVSISCFCVNVVDADSKDKSSNTQETVEGEVVSEDNSGNQRSSRREVIFNFFDGIRNYYEQRNKPIEEQPQEQPTEVVEETQPEDTNEETKEQGTVVEEVPEETPEGEGETQPETNPEEPQENPQGEQPQENPQGEEPADSEEIPEDVVELGQQSFGERVKGLFKNALDSATETPAELSTVMFDKSSFIYNGQDQHPQLIDVNSEANGYKITGVSYQRKTETGSVDKGTYHMPLDETINYGLYSVDATYTYKLIIGEDEFGPELSDTINCAYEIKKLDVLYDHERSYKYDGNVHVPEITFFNANDPAQTLDLKKYIDDEQPGDYRVNTYNVLDPSTPCEPLEVGSYYGEIILTNPNLHLNVKDTFEFSIYQKSLKFVGFDVSNGVETITSACGHDFYWFRDADKVYMEYNGYSPIMSLTEEIKFAIPDAIFSYEEDGETKYIKLDRGLEGEYSYVWNPIDMNLGYPKDVGTYNLIIKFKCGSDYGVELCSMNVSFAIRPKPVSIEWTNTMIDYYSLNKIPGYKINGISPADTYMGVPKVVPAISYQRLDGTSFGLVPPIGVGQYAATVSSLRDIDIDGKILGESKNYVLNNDYSTSYVIVDHSSGHSSEPIYGDGSGVIRTGIINQSDLSGVLVQPPSQIEAQSMINALSSSSDPNAQAVGIMMEEALRSGRNVNLYLDVTNCENVSSLEIPQGKNLFNIYTLDLQLYACIDGITERYKISDTGSYEVKVGVTLSEMQFGKLGYDDKSSLFIARYHDSEKPNAVWQVFPTENETQYGAKTYTFVIGTNQFSSYVIYAKTPEVIKPTKTFTYRAVPNTSY